MESSIIRSVYRAERSGPGDKVKVDIYLLARVMTMNTRMFPFQARKGHDGKSRACVRHNVEREAGPRFGIVYDKSGELSELSQVSL